MQTTSTILLKRYLTPLFVLLIGYGFVPNVMANVATANACYLARVMPAPMNRDATGQLVEHASVALSGMTRQEYTDKFNDPNVIATRCLDAGYQQKDIGGTLQWMPAPKVSGVVDGIENHACWEWSFQYICTGNVSNSCSDWDHQHAGDFGNKPLSWKKKGESDISVIAQLYNDFGRGVAEVNRREYYANNERWSPHCVSQTTGERFTPFEDFHSTIAQDGSPTGVGHVPTPLGRGVDELSPIVDGVAFLDDQQNTITETLLYEVEVHPKPSMTYGVLQDRLNEIDQTGFGEETLISYSHQELASTMRLVDNQPILIDPPSDVFKDRLNDQSTREDEHWVVENHYRSYTGEQIDHCHASCPNPTKMKVVSCHAYDFTKLPRDEWGEDYKHCIEPVFEVYCESTGSATLTPSGNHCGVAVTNSIISELTGETVAAQTIEQCYDGQPEACVSSPNCELVSYEPHGEPNSTGLFQEQVQYWRCQEQVVTETGLTQSIASMDSPESSFNKAAAVMALAEQTKNMNQADVASGNIRLFSGEAMACRYMTDEALNMRLAATYGHAAYQAYSTYATLGTTPYAYVPGADVGAASLSATQVAGSAYAADNLSISPEALRQQTLCCGSVADVTKPVNMQGIISGAMNRAMGSAQSNAPVCETQDLRVALAREKGQYSPRGKISGLFQGQLFEGAAYQTKSTYVSKKLSMLGQDINLEKAKNFCVFEDVLSRIVQSQGKSIINQLATHNRPSVYEVSHSFTTENTWIAMGHDDWVHWQAYKEGDDVYISACNGGTSNPSCAIPPQDFDNADAHWNLYYLNANQQETIALSNNLILSGSCENGQCNYSIKQYGASDEPMYDVSVPIGKIGTRYLGMAEVEILTTNKRVVQLNFKRIDLGNVNWSSETVAISDQPTSLNTQSDIQVSVQCDDQQCRYFFQVKTNLSVIAADDCRGFTPQELALIDFNQIDFTDYIESLRANGMSDVDSAEMVSKIIGHEIQPESIKRQSEPVIFADGLLNLPEQMVNFTIADALPEGDLDYADVDWGDGTTERVAIDTHVNKTKAIRDYWQTQKPIAEAALLAFESSKTTIENNITHKENLKNQYCDTSLSSHDRVACNNAIHALSIAKEELNPYLCDDIERCGSIYREIVPVNQLILNSANDSQRMYDQEQTNLNGRIQRGERSIDIPHFFGGSTGTWTVSATIHNNAGKSWDALYTIKTTYDFEQDNTDLGGGQLILMETNAQKINDTYQHRNPMP